MDRRFLKRYVVLIFILVLCACATWYITGENGKPYADAVLVELLDNTDCFGDNGTDRVLQYLADTGKGMAASRYAVGKEGVFICQTRRYI